MIIMLLALCFYLNFKHLLWKLAVKSLQDLGCFVGVLLISVTFRVEKQRETGHLVFQIVALNKKEGASWG